MSPDQSEDAGYRCGINAAAIYRVPMDPHAIRSIHRDMRVLRGALRGLHRINASEGSAAARCRFRLGWAKGELAGRKERARETRRESSEA